MPDDSGPSHQPARTRPRPTPTGTHGGRRRIRRQLPHVPTPADPSTPHQPPDLHLTYRDPWGEKIDSYDFAALNLPGDLAALLADTARRIFPSLEPATRRTYWYSLRTFSEFVRSAQPPITSLDDLTDHMVQRYLDWLNQRTTAHAGAPLTQKTKATRLLTLKTFLETAATLPGNRLPQTITFPAHLMPRRTQPVPVIHLDEAQLKEILLQCYIEIRDAERRFDDGQKILAIPCPPPGKPPDLNRIVHAIAEHTVQGFPSQAAMLSRGIASISLRRHGGLRHLRSYVSATPDTLAPLYLALIIQLAANPFPLLNISRDCVHPSFIDDHMKSVEWLKLRSGRADVSVQRRFFDTRKKHSPPNLIDLVIKITAPLVLQAHPRWRDFLFLIPNERNQRIQLMSMNKLNGAVKRFRSRANRRIAQWNTEHPDRPKDFIPQFTLCQLRPSAASIHYLATGGDIRHTQRILNHKHATTTIPYIETPRVQRKCEDTIANLQQLFLNHIKGTRTNSPCRGQQPDNETPAAASLGHLCKNPFRPQDNPAPGKHPRLCRHFQSCFSCPGLVVPLDADHLAKLLLLRDALDAARARLNPARWHQIYEPTSLSLDAILTQFPDALLPDARAICHTLPPIPDIE